jgi:hypothetical protein
MVTNYKGIATLALIGLGNALELPVTKNALNDAHFMNYIAKQNKNYKTSNEFLMRRQIFIEKDTFINDFNSQQGQTMQVAHNKFSDWTDEEYAGILGYKSFSTKDKVKHKKLKTFIPEDPIEPVKLYRSMDSDIDWRNLGAVTPVVD